MGAIQSSFFGIYLLTSTKKHEISKYLLGLLSTILAIRMAKSCGYYFSNDNLPTLLENFGYAAHLAIAPLLFFYIKSFIQENFKFKKTYLLYLLPSFLTLLFSPFLDDWFWLEKYEGYLLSLFYFGIFFPFIYFTLIKTENITRDEKKWLYLLTFGITLVWAAYSANYLLGLVSYITAPVIFSFVVYVVSFIGLRQNSIFTKTEKYQHSNLTLEKK